MPFPTITACLTAAFAVLMVLLSVQTSLRRAALGIAHGDAEDKTLRRRIRAHGNFTEYAPLAVVILLMVEISGATRINTLILALAFLLARLLHAAGMLYMSGPALRALGMLVQHAAFLYGAVVLLNRVLRAA